MNDIFLSGNVFTDAADVETIIAEVEETGLHFNRNKCEIIANDFNTVSSFKVFDQFRLVQREDIYLLGALILKEPAVVQHCDRRLRTLKSDQSSHSSTLTCSHTSLKLHEHAETVLHTASQKWHTGDKERNEAGTFCLFSIRCFHALLHNAILPQCFRALEDISQTNYDHLEISFII